MISVDLKSIAILNIYSVDYHCIINKISNKSEVINLFKKCWFKFKKWNIVKYKLLSLYISKEQRNAW